MTDLGVRGDRVIVKPETPKEYQQGQIVVLDQDAPDVMGVVIAFGDVVDVDVDDIVIFPPSAGQVLEYAGERYLVLRESELLGVFE